MATKTVKKKTESRVENIKTTAQKINKQAVDFTDNLVDETLATGEEWQKVFAKAMKTGTVLLGKQQDMTLDTLEAVKGHILKSGFRFRKLFSFDISQNKKTVKKDAKAPKTAKEAVQNLDAKTRVKKVAQKVAAADAKAKTVKKATAKKNVEKSDLKVIEGVGPKLESILNEGGIFTYEQMAKTDPKVVKAILEAAGPRYKMHVPDTWAKQAKLAAAGKTEELKALQAELKAGKAKK